MTVSIPCKAMFAKSGEITPPPMWQNALLRAEHKRVGSDPKDDPDLLLINLDSLDQRPNQVTPSQPIGFSQSLLHLGCKRFQSTNQQPYLLGLYGCVSTLL